MGASPHFSARELTVEQRRQYFRLLRAISQELGGGILTVERALGVSKGVLTRRGRGKLPIKYESLLAAEGLLNRIRHTVIINQQSEIEEFIENDGSNEKD